MKRAIGDARTGGASSQSCAVASLDVGDRHRRSERGLREYLQLVADTASAVVRPGIDATQTPSRPAPSSKSGDAPSLGRLPIGERVGRRIDAHEFAKRGTTLVPAARDESRDGVAGAAADVVGATATTNAVSNSEISSQSDPNSM